MIKEITYSKQEFENFKSDVCHRVKDLGQLGFIEYVLLSNIIDEFLKNDNILFALYLLAMTDYLSNLNEIPLYNKYNDLRHYKLQERVYPMSIMLAARIEGKSEEELTKNAIPEFLKYNIVEGEIFDVA